MVISVIGVLITGLIVLIDPVAKRDQARDAGARNSIAQLASALEAFNARTGAYPQYWEYLGPSYSNELKVIPTVPQGTGRFGLDVYPDNCTWSGRNIPTEIACTDVTVYFTQLRPANAATPIYCWRSSTGQVTEVAAATNCQAP